MLSLGDYFHVSLGALLSGKQPLVSAKQGDNLSSERSSPPQRQRGADSQIRGRRRFGVARDICDLITFGRWCLGIFDAVIFVPKPS